MTRAKRQKFLRALREGGMDEAAQLAIEFLVVTAPRTGGALGTRWDEADVRAAIGNIPLRGRAQSVVPAARHRDHQAS
jgi:hypothetical protein